MNPHKRFKLSSQAMLLAAISAAYPVTGYCVAAGRVEFAFGDVESVMANGSRHPLGRGADINAGESISTAAGARAQIRFSDGGFVSLQPGTLFRVDEYNYQDKTDGKEKGFFSLLKGGFRAVTGFIGHLHKNTYRVRTPAATLGIRGTGYNMALRDDGLFVNVGEGAISLNNNAGLLVVVAGNAAYVADFNTAPRLTAQLPLAPPKSLPDPDFTVADQRDSFGNLTILPVLLSGPGYALAYAFTGTGVAPIYGAGELTGVTATFSGTSQLIQYSGLPAGGQTGGAVTEALGAASVPFSATDGIIGWGRWVGGPTTGTVPQTGVFDYVAGIPTPAMPTSGTATYSLMGYTSPTATDGSVGYSVNGSLSADFSAATVGVNMTVANSVNAYAINTLTTPLAMSGAIFSGSIITPSSTNSCFSGACSTSINGLFAGANASRAGLSYLITGTGSTGLDGIQGVAAFAKN